jgi:hypothetical protein
MLPTRISRLEASLGSENRQNLQQGQTRWGTFVSTQQPRPKLLFPLCHLHLTARRTGRLKSGSPTNDRLTRTGVPGSARPKALEGKRGDSTHWLSLGDQAPPRHLGAVQSMAA